MASSLTLPDSRTLAYALDSSPKEGPLIILSNSLTAPLSVWDHVVKVLNNNGYRTLRYDQPGHGGSSAPKDLSPTFDSMAEDVHHLLEKLEINKYPNVVSKLAICDTISSSPINAGTEDTFGPRVAAAREAGNLDSTIQSTLERWFGKEWLENSPQETQRMRTVMSGTTIDGFEACCNALRSETFDLRPRFAKIGSSVDDAICIVGEKDANLPETMKEMRDKIQEGFEAAGKSNKIELVIIKNAGHVSFVDGFEQFTAEVLKWLEA
ncbi:hypothetical protein H9Q74_011400 [Fusarium xylarioides]|nr:hypothetical protein H9Q71_010582 [Fusarium xylarioides]KAG5815928.1 hypothetical protein H9Q74_011400 [Fusarium xylarioides]